MNSSIRLKILLAVLFPLLLLSLILGMYFISVRFEDARENLEIQGQRFAQYVGAASEFNLLAGNRKELQSFAKNQTSILPLVTAMMFLDNQDKPLASAGDNKEIHKLQNCFADSSHCKKLTDRLYFNVPVYSYGVSVGENPELSGGLTSAQREPLGRVIFFYDAEPLFHLQTVMLRDGLSITIAAALIAGGIAFFFATGITKPIYRLSRVVGEIQSGNLSARTDPIGRGEVLDLELGINAMAAKVEQANENLQQKVEEANKDALISLAQLKVKNKDLEEARNRAEEAGKVKDLFLARMSHELRTPLASIIGYLKLMEDTEDMDQRRTYGRIVDQASGILLTTIDDILDYIRLEDGDVRLEHVEFYLRDCLQNVVALQRPSATSKRLNLDCVIDTSVPETAVGDPSRLAQVVTNLLANAIKFTEFGEVRLMARAEMLNSGRVDLIVYVRDTGIGIPKEKQALLFQPFVQAEDNISRRFGGSGLGLSITRRLVHAMGGNIELDSDIGRGVEICFNVLLSTLTDGVERIAPKKNLIEQQAQRVLLVEDNDLNRQLLRIQLEAEGVAVTCAADGREALENTSSPMQYDFVLMDVHLPGLDGIELAPRLKAILGRTPIYALTANITGSEEQQLRQAGVEKILYKPLSESTLKSLLTWSAEHPSSQSDVATRRDSALVPLPTGISKAVVLAEFDKLLSESLAELDRDRWTAVFDVTHKLLGSARLFTKGEFSERVLQLEESARREQRSEFLECHEAVLKALDDLRH